MSLSNNFPTTPPSLNLDFANVKALDPRVTFTRSTTATYYDGVTVAMAEQNLLTYSQDFANAGWIAANTTKTSTTTTAPDGTSTAITFTASAVSASSFVIVSPVVTGLSTNTVYTGSIFVKKGNSQFCYVTLYNNAGTDHWAIAVVNLDAGTITQTSNGGSISNVATAIKSYGGGWYQVAVTGSWSTINQVSVRCSYVNTGTPTFGANGFLSSNITPAGTETVIAWGAQLEQRSSVTAYTATTTQPITNYIPVLQTAASGIPRFDHNPTTGESLGFLIEEARTNLFTYSAQFDNAAWTLGATTVTANTIVAPDGTLTGDKLIADATSSVVHNIRQAVTSSGVPVTFSFYAKQGEYPKCGIREGAATGGYATFNLSTGAVIEQTVGTATITAVGNGWYRCTFTLTATNPRADLYPLPSAYTSGSPISYTYTGNGYSGIYLWGAQAEAGAFPTSYIATIAAAATRNADAAQIDIMTPWFNLSEGAFYFEGDLVRTTGKFPGLYKTGTTNADRIGQYVNSTGTTDFYRSTEGAQASTVPQQTNFKSASVYSTSTLAVVVNAGTVGTGTATLSLTTPTQMYIGRFDEYMTGHIRRFAYYPARLTNAQLQALTS